MEINETTYYLIEAYLQGKLSGKELADFEARLKKEPDLAKEVKLYQEVGLSLADPALITYEQEVALIADQAAAAYTSQQTAAPQAKIRRFSMWKITAIAASVILLLVATWLFTRPISTEALFAKHYTPYKESLQVRSVEEAVETKLTEGIAAYQQGDYTTSVATFQGLLSKHGEDFADNKPTFYLYLGLAYMGEGDDQKALAAFNEVIKKEPNLNAQTANWYIALVHLRANRIDECKASLAKVLEYSEKGKFANRAKVLLKNI